MAIDPNAPMTLERFVQRLSSEIRMFENAMYDVVGGTPQERSYNDWHEIFAFYTPPDLKVAPETDD